MKVKKIIEAEARDVLKEMLADGELSPAVSKRIRALLRDLAAKDIDMTMLDLAQLSRAVIAGEASGSTGGEYPASVVVCGEDDQALVGMCDGPEADGRCPWASSDGKLPCGGSWLSTHGWQFKVAEDATDVCPLAVLLVKAS